MKVPFSDLKAMHDELKKELAQAVTAVVNRCDFILGEDVGRFEKEFAALCKSRFAAGVSSGTDALFIALKALGLGEADEVIVPAFSYIASALAVSYTGARCVFADIDPATYNISPDKAAALITKKTKAIMPVHLYGQPADMPEILRLSRRHGLKIVEDAAQAHGAKVRMKPDSWAPVGGLGDAGCFSFYPTKNLGGLGDGGMITTNDEKLYRRIGMLRDYGRVSKYEHAIIGYNCRLDTLQAAFLRVKLRKLNQYNRMRRSAAMIYNRMFAGVDGVTTPAVSRDVEHVYHVYAVRVKNRDKVYKALLKNGIGAIIHYPIPIHLQKAYKALGYKRGDLPVSERVCREIISLPLFPHITHEQIASVVDAVKNAL